MGINSFISYRRLSIPDKATDIHVLSGERSCVTFGFGVIHLSPHFEIIFVLFGMLRAITHAPLWCVCVTLTSQGMTHILTEMQSFVVIRAALLITVVRIKERVSMDPGNVLSAVPDVCVPVSSETTQNYITLKWMFPSLLS